MVNIEWLYSSKSGSWQESDKKINKNKLIKSNKPYFKSFFFHAFKNMLCYIHVTKYKVS